MLYCSLDDTPQHLLENRKFGGHQPCTTCGCHSTLLRKKKMCGPTGRTFSWSGGDGEDTSISAEKSKHGNRNFWHREWGEEEYDREISLPGSSSPALFWTALSTNRHGNSLHSVGQCCSAKSMSKKSLSTLSGRSNNAGGCGGDDDVRVRSRIVMSPR